MYTNQQEMLTWNPKNKRLCEEVSDSTPGADFEVVSLHPSDIFGSSSWILSPEIVYQFTKNGQQFDS